MNAIIKKYTLKFFVLTISLLSLCIYNEGDTLAVIFLNGVPTIETDLQPPAEDFFGGSDSNVLQQAPSTDLTITTQLQPRSIVNNVFGGGRSTPLLPNTVTGDIRLRVENTNGNLLYGGSNSMGGLLSIGGSIFMNVTNSDFANGIYGGSHSIVGVHQSHIAGSIYMNLDHVITPEVFGAGDAPGTGPNNIAVAGNIDITVTDSQIDNLILTSHQDNVNVGGNVSLHTTGSTFDTLFGTIDTTVFGGLKMDLGAGTQIATNLILTRDGTILGPVTINITDSQIREILLVRDGIVPGPIDINIVNSTIARDVILGPYGVGQIETVNFTAQRSTFDRIITGPEANNALLDNVTLYLNECILNTLYLGGIDGLTNTVTATVENSTINAFLIVGDGGQLNNVNLTVQNITTPGLWIGNGGAINKATVNILSGNIRTFEIGGNANITEATVNIFGGTIDLFKMTGVGGNVNLAITNIYGGSINNLILGSQGDLTSAIANIHSGTIGTIIMGTAIAGGNVTSTALNITGGDISRIVSRPAESSTITFQLGEKSLVRTFSNAPTPVSSITIEKHARTQWGTPGEDFSVKTKNFILSGELFITQNTILDLNIQDNFNADGGIIIPEGLSHTTTVPFIQLTGGPKSTLTINNPLTITLAFSPDLLGVKSIPLATTTPEFAHGGLFAQHNRKSLIWSDTIFDEHNHTWFLTNIRASEDFYGFSAAREATNWLRQQHTWSIQRRASQLLDHGTDGLWINVQGGYEKLDAAIGEAKMPWVTASIGYDYIQHFPKISSKAIYGFGIGASKGDNKWSTVNTTKNDILMGTVAGYIGLMHNSGIYSTISAQFAASNITTKCTGFSENYKWKEMIPTEAIELGWQHTFGNGFKINPHGQIIFEQLAKNHFKLPYENDTAVLEKDFLTTTFLGVAGEYTFNAGTPINLQASVDWIQGITGDFAAKSRLLKMKFKDKNDTSVIRTSLGINSQLRENLSVQCNVFTDLGNDKGVGGQLGATYTF